MEPEEIQAQLDRAADVYGGVSRVPRPRRVQMKPTQTYNHYPPEYKYRHGGVMEYWSLPKQPLRRPTLEELDNLLPIERRHARCREYAVTYDWYTNHFELEDMPYNPKLVLYGWFISHRFWVWVDADQKKGSEDDH